jgi:hypothetical protein
LEIEHQRHAGRENGRLILTYDQFAKYMHRNSVATAQRECCALGFVEVTAQGRCGPFKRPNQYRLTYQNMTGNGTYAAATNEWRTIKTREEAEAISAKARSGGTKPATPRKQKAGPKNDTPSGTISETRPSTISDTPPAFPGHKNRDSLLYYGESAPSDRERSERHPRAKRAHPAEGGQTTKPSNAPAAASPADGFASPPPETFRAHHRRRVRRLCNAVDRCGGRSE